MHPLLPILVLASLAPQGTGQTPPDQERQPRRPAPMPIPEAYVKHRGGAVIRIDGSLDEWPKVLPISLRDTRQVSGTALGAYRGPNDVSGQMYMLWDEQFLYIGLQVLDEWHIGLHAKDVLHQEIPPIDNVLITFDPNRDTRAYGDDPGRAEDRSFYLAHAESLGDKLLVWDRRKGNRDAADGAVCRIDRREKEGVTVHEARIPWREILPPGQEAGDRRCFDMQVVINDYDEPMDMIPQTRVGWNFGMGPEIAPGLFGTVMLLKELDPQRLPPMPPPAQVNPSVAEEKRYWVELYNDLSATKPAFCTADTPDPALVGGAERYRMLKDLEAYLGTFPRIDNLEYHYRIQRRMRREVAGIAAAGVPFYWDHAMRDVLRRVVPVPPKDGIRLFRLPQGGWYVRSYTTNFVIDPCGAGVERLYLMGGVDFAVMTRPTELTRRHDQLLIRMSASKVKRPFFTHVDFHLPGAKPGSMSLVEAFKDYQLRGLRRITPVGTRDKDGKVTLSTGYLIEWPDGHTLVHAGLGCNAALIKRLGVRPDVLILSGLYGEDAVALARDFGAKQIVIEDVLIAEEYPARFGGRLTLANALKLQNSLKPNKSIILAPGESIDIGW